MKTHNLNVDNTNISAIQFNLFDFGGERPRFNEALNQKIIPNTELNIEKGVVLTSPNHFEFDTRQCPHCGQITLIKKKFVERHVIIDKIGDTTLYLKEYFCKKCGKYPKVELKNIVEKFKKVSIQFKEKILAKVRNGRKSLRKTSKDLKIDDVTLSHQSVLNIVNFDINDEIVFDVEELSGYIEYDEQFIDIDGKSLPKAQLLDAITNQTIAIRKLDAVTSENVKNFIESHIPENKRKCLITDHDTTYTSVVEDLEFDKHQLCIVHFIRIIERKVNEIIKKNNYDDEEIKNLKEYAGRIKGIFLAKTKEDFIYLLNKFFKKWDDVPEPLKLFYNKKIVRDMHKLTHHLFDSNIPRSTNLLESKFSGVQQKSEKSLFKTVKGCFSYLKPVTERQNDELKRV